MLIEAFSITMVLLLRLRAFVGCMLFSVPPSRAWGRLAAGMAKQFASHQPLAFDHHMRWRHVWVHVQQLRTVAFWNDWSWLADK
jgi:hypothetical protein